MSENDNDIEMILENFDTISNIKPDDKLSVSGDKFLVDTPSLTQGIIRTLYRESRNETIDKISDMVNKLFSRIDDLTQTIEENLKNEYIKMEEEKAQEKKKNKQLKQRRKCRNLRKDELINQFSDSDEESEHDKNIKTTPKSISTESESSDTIESDNDVDKLVSKIINSLRQQKHISDAISEKTSDNVEIYDELNRYISILNDSVTGMLNLKLTYVKDKKIVDDIDTIILRIKNRVGKVEQIILITQNGIISD